MLYKTLLCLLKLHYDFFGNDVAFSVMLCVLTLTATIPLKLIPNL